MMDVKERLEHNLLVINKGKNKPYFARIDFNNINNSDYVILVKQGDTFFMGNNE